MSWLLISNLSKSSFQSLVMMKIPMHMAMMEAAMNVSTDMELRIARKIVQMKLDLAKEPGSTVVLLTQATVAAAATSHTMDSLHHVLVHVMTVVALAQMRSTRLMLKQH
jgi:hypothetical protein